MERAAADVEAFHLGVADLDAFLVDCCVKDSLASRRPFKISTSPGFVKTVYTDPSFDLESTRRTRSTQHSVSSVSTGPRTSNQGSTFPTEALYYGNPEVDELLEKAAVKNDPGRRRGYFFHFQEILQEALPVINLLSYNAYTVASERVRDTSRRATACEATSPACSWPREQETAWSSPSSSGLHARWPDGGALGGSAGDIAA
jgi:hypothetical protein